jgi:hypothetical protein
MLIGNLHRWLGNVSGGAGPISRWIWASLLFFSAAALLYIVMLAIN